MASIPLITTTTRISRSPSESFVGAGLQYLFEKALGPQRWTLIDPSNARGFHENAALCREAPFLVYGGVRYHSSSEQFEWAEKRMWREYLLGSKARVFLMGGGATRFPPSVSLDRFVTACKDSEILRRWIAEQTAGSLCITVRDSYAHALLDALAVTSHLLPCPSLWATRMWQIQPAKHRPYLLLVPFPSVSASKIGWMARIRRKPLPPRSDLGGWKALYMAFKAAGQNVKVLCHELSEYQALRETVPATDLWYQGDVYTLLREYAFAHTVISGRVEGMLAAYGLPGTKALHLSRSIEGSAVDLLPAIPCLAEGAFSVESVSAALAELRPASPADFALWENAYTSLIHSSLA